MTVLIRKLKSLSQLKLNAIANYAGNIWSNLLSFLLVPIYLHYLGVEAYGLIGGFYAVISFIGLLDLGLSATIKREVALRKTIPEKLLTIPDLLRTTEIIYWCTGTVILLLMVLLAQPISSQWINAENIAKATVKWELKLRKLYTSAEKGEETYENYLHSSCNFTSSILVRKTSLIEIIGYDVSIEGREDLDLYLRLLLKDYRFAFISEPPLMKYRWHENNTAPKSSNYGYVQVYEKHLTECLKLGDSMRIAKAKKLIYQSLAKAHYRLGNYDKSRDYWQKAFIKNWETAFSTSF